MSIAATLIPFVFNPANPMSAPLQRHRWRLYGAGLLLSASAGVWAQVPFNGTYTQNFDTLAASGVGLAWANNSTLPGWFLFNKNLAPITSYVAGNGASNTGSFYSLGLSAERALGGVASGGAYFGSPAQGAVAGWIALAVRNETGGPVDGITLRFNGEQWRNGGNTERQPMVLEYGMGATFADVPEWLPAGANFNWQSPVATGTAAAVDGNAAGRVNNVGGDLRGLGWAPGATLWLRWVELNDVGNDHGLAIDDVSITLALPDTTAPTLQASTPAAAATGVALTPEIKLSFDEAVKPGSGSFELRQGGTVVATLLAGDAAKVKFSGSTITLNAGVRLAVNTPYTLVPVGEPVLDTSGNVWTGTTLGFTTGDEPPVTRISAIQGSGDQSPLVGQKVTVSAVVTAHMPGLSGFFVQEEAEDSDGDAATSEGVFVYYGNANPGVDESTVGKRVQISASVSEFRNQTQLSAITDFVVRGAAVLPEPVRIALPVSDMGQWERLEGMRVEVVSTTAGGKLVVSDNRTLGRYGNVTLSADTPLAQYTEVNAPSVAGYAAYVQTLQRSQIILDDRSGAQNPESVPGRGGLPLSASNTLRAGDGVDRVIGVLDQFFDAAASEPYLTSYRVQPTQTPQFTGAARPSAAELQQAVGAATLKIASANVLNFFNLTGATSGSSQVMFNTPLGNQQGIRGANSIAELDRQRAKIVANLLGLGADVYGLMEVQNNGFGPGSAIQDLADALNASADKPAGAVYAVVKAPFSEAAGTVPGAGTDAITVAILYRSDRVTPVGGAAVPNVSTYDAFNGSIGGARVPIAQTFAVGGSTEQFTLVVNHFKSKGSVLGGAGNADAFDGQGANNAARVKTAQQLSNWLATRPTGATSPHVVLVGDFNAYAKEDPITTLETGGYVKVSQGLSYAFDGMWGSLDHVLVSTSLQPSVGRAVKWAINAEEPEVLDYNVEFKSLDQQASFYAPTAYRSSDHNPILLGLNFGGQAPSFSGVPANAQAVVVGQAADLADVVVADADSPVVTLSIVASSGQVLGLEDADAAQPGIQLRGSPEQVTQQLRDAMYMASAVGPASLQLSVSDGVHAAVTASYPLLATAAGVVNPANRFNITGASQIAVAGEVVGGGANCRLTEPPQVVAAPGTPRPGAVVPHGLLKLNTDGCDAGALVTVRLTYPNDLPSGAEYWKWGRTADNTAQHWYRIPATLQGRIVSFVLRDGGLGDDDLLANGRVQDPSALVLPAAVVGGTPAAIPSLSEWAVALLSLMMGGLALRLRRRNS
ncbi:MAG: ExeM/NucH family extracellular endonuclease [Comamonas sp.]|jgi:predicted extracellular nuclease|uniref:ExeM/NucH family extracellular endonuclease n=1 Tax=Comamonas sp. TaxID=34028 RepID=UPI002823F84A|nr:ExeM/NucH family extracellular endonuclease [Comamonas sp.]MDR0212801.1 ExeM/NucH family extracellular endonuclease [Comamonas sp.]